MPEPTMTEAEAQALVQREKDRGRKISEGHQRRKAKLEEARALLEKAERERKDAENRELSIKAEEEWAEAREQLCREVPDFEALLKPERRKLILARLRQMREASK